MTVAIQWQAVVAAFLLDMATGDPVFAMHPVRLMGRAIERAEPVFRRLPVNPVVSGGLFAFSLIVSGWAVAFLVHTCCLMVSPVASILADTVMLYFCISACELERSAMAVAGPLAEGRESLARERLSLIVGRDVGRLDSSGIARAAVETVAENLVDGVVSPLFFAVIGGAPLAVAYRMANTLDSMVGYRNARYGKFGKVAARIDDAANFLPARLSVPIIALAAFLLGRRGKAVLSTAATDGRNHSSPNSGYPEAAFAGALDVWMGGPGYYGGVCHEKPFIGKGYGNARPGDIRRACDLMLLSAALATGIATLLCGIG